MPSHYIQAISYAKDILECACGATMKAKADPVGLLAWTGHRREMGQPVRTLGSSPIGEKRLVKA